MQALQWRCEFGNLWFVSSAPCTSYIEKTTRFFQSGCLVDIWYLFALPGSEGMTSNFHVVFPSFISILCLFQNLLTFMQAKLRHYLLCFDVTSVNLSSLTSHERPAKEKAVVKNICLSNNNWNKNEILHPCPLIRIELGGLHGWIIQVNSVKPPIKSVRWPLKAFAEITCFVKQNTLQCIIKGIFCDVSEFTSGLGNISWRNFCALVTFLIYT